MNAYIQVFVDVPQQHWHHIVSSSTGYVYQLPRAHTYMSCDRIRPFLTPRAPLEILCKVTAHLSSH